MTSYADLMRCPLDGGALHADGAPTSPALVGFTGKITCAACGKPWSVDDGIARFVEQFDHEDKENEMAARDKCAAKYEERWDSFRNAIETAPCLQAMGSTVDDIVVELGCGTGRITRQYLGSVRFVVAIDFSVESLRLLRNAVPAELRDRLLLVQSDICTPPLAPKAFSKVVSFQVIEHMPTAALRERAVDAARALMGKGGALVATVYHWSTWKQYDAKRGRGDNTAKSGYHATEPPIYFTNFVEDEARALFSRGGLQITDVAGVCLQIPLLPLFRWLALPLNRWLARTGFGIRNSHLLLIQATSPDR